MPVGPPPVRAPERSRAPGARTLGVLAVVVLVAAFSLSSTLVKRAETPGVLVALWRLVLVSVAWNVVLRLSGRRVSLADVRAVWPCGVLFGLNLAVFFSGATRNSVANAALIGACAPLLIVPVGAWLFREHLAPRALAFAALAFGGVVLVLLSAPPGGDATWQGNVLGVVAMVLLVGYVAATRRFRREMDVTTFMATICPIATLAVLPVALGHGGVLGVSRTGWAYTVLLACTSGITAQGLLVYAQRTVQIGSIAIAQIAQPALAVVWSSLLLGEVVNGRQTAGIALVMAGLLGFTLLNQRAGRPGRAP